MSRSPGTTRFRLGSSKLPLMKLSLAGVFASSAAKSIWKDVDDCGSTWSVASGGAVELRFRDFIVSERCCCQIARHPASTTHPKKINIQEETLGFSRFDDFACFTSGTTVGSFSGPFLVVPVVWFGEGFKSTM